jgi:hypothetical protein
MVAKSYQNLKVVKEPYMVNGRMYVQVELGNGSAKQVRWYSDAEYKKMYPDAVIDHSNDPYWKSQKEVLGFKAGFITIFTGNTYENKEWFKEIGCTYRKFWGWGLPGDMELPAELPEGIAAVRLDWELVGKDDEVLKTDAEVQKAVASLTEEPSVSEYQGTIGDRITVELTVKKAIKLNGFYGESTMHIMEDAAQNVYVWTTASKTWAEGAVKVVAGTIKDHREYKNTKQTVLTRCKEVVK